MSRTPRIVGPAAWPAGGGPPLFTVDAAGLPCWTAEVATAPVLLASIDGRTEENYFFGADGAGMFGTGTTWRMPQEVWDRLAGATVLYYRVVAFDQVAGRSDMSVDDQHLDDLPQLRIGRSPPSAADRARVPLPARRNDDDDCSDHASCDDEGPSAGRPAEPGLDHPRAGG